MDMQDWWSFTSASYEPLIYCWNAASVNLFCRYYFGSCSSQLAQLVPLSYSQEKSTFYSVKLHDFSVTISRCYKDVHVDSFFLCTTRLWNSLPIECFPLACNLNDFKFKNQQTSFNCRLFLNRFPVCFNLFVSKNSMRCSGFFSLAWSESQLKNDLFDDVSVILLSMLMILLSTLHVIRHLIYGSN